MAIKKKKRSLTSDKALIYHYTGIIEKLEDNVKEAVFNATLTQDHLLVTTKKGKFFACEKELDPNHLEEWGSIIIAKIAKNHLK